MSSLRNSSLVHQLLLGVGGVSVALLLMTSAQPDDKPNLSAACEVDAAGHPVVMHEWTKLLLSKLDDSKGILGQ